MFVLFAYIHVISAGSRRARLKNMCFVCVCVSLCVRVCRCVCVFRGVTGLLGLPGRGTPPSRAACSPENHRRIFTRPCWNRPRTKSSISNGRYVSISSDSPHKNPLKVLKRLERPYTDTPCRILIIFPLFHLYIPNTSSALGKLTFRDRWNGNNASTFPPPPRDFNFGSTCVRSFRGDVAETRSSRSRKDDGRTNFPLLADRNKNSKPPLFPHTRISLTTKKNIISSRNEKHIVINK